MASASSLEAAGADVGSNKVVVAAIGRLNQWRGRRSSTGPRRTDELLDFPDPDLLRATPLLTLLHCGGFVFDGRQGSADTYRMSSRQPHIDFFISHNWAMGRVRKFLLLAMHFNMPLAVLVAAIAILIISVGTCLGLAPLVDSDHGQRGALGTFLVAPLFTLTLFLGHEVAGLFGRRGAWVFLDKVCIHQSDQERQRQGILKLGGFMKNSSSVVALFSSVYLKKMWTVYELATFLVLHGGDVRCLTIAPAGMAIVSLAANFIALLALASQHLLSELGVVSWQVARIALAVGVSCSGMLAARVWAYQLQEAMGVAAAFSIDDAQCTVPSDRDLVRANVITLMREYGYVAEDVPDEHVLKVFDRFVRRAVPIALRASLGRVYLPYKFLIPSSVCVFSALMDEWSVSYYQQHFAGAEECAYSLLANVTCAFASLPLVAAFALAWCRAYLHRGWAAEVAYMALGGLGTAVLIFLMVVALTFGLQAPLFASTATASAARRAAFLTLCAGLLLATLYVYRRRPAPSGQGFPGVPPSPRGYRSDVPASVEVPAGARDLGEGGLPADPGLANLGEPHSSGAWPHSGHHNGVEIVEAAAGVGSMAATDIPRADSTDVEEGHLAGARHLGAVQVAESAVGIAHVIPWHSCAVRAETEQRHFSDAWSERVVRSLSSKYHTGPFGREASLDSDSSTADGSTNLSTGGRWDSCGVICAMSSTPIELLN